MALKTVVKLHLNGGDAPLSIEMQRAINVDQSVINNDEGTDVTYVDHEEVKPEPKTNADTERETIEGLIANSKTIADVKKHEKLCNTDELKAIYKAKYEELLLQS